MRVALFGGSFNPPHIAHQMVVLYVLETRPVDEVWLVPCLKHPFDKSLETFEHRLRMCELLVAPLAPRARVTDIERTLGGESRTLRTVKALQAAHPGQDFSLVVGSDIEPDLDSWYGAGELRALVPFIVVDRGGAAGQGGSARVAMPAVSSTEIRARIGRGEPVRDLVPARVLDYMGQRKLYEGSRAS